MKLKKYFFGILLIVFISFTVSSCNTEMKQANVPSSIDEVEEFVDSYYYNSQTEKQIDTGLDLAYYPIQNSYSVQLTLNNGNIVEFMTLEFDNSESAQKYYRDNDRLYNVKLMNINTNLPKYKYNSFRTSEGVYITIWQKENWVIWMRGNSREDINKVKDEFNKFLGQQNNSTHNNPL